MIHIKAFFSGIAFWASLIVASIGIVVVCGTFYLVCDTIYRITHREPSWIKDR